ncbi:allantoinase precursor [Venturia nashicola]|uniref:allantoinase n=1 Tax=Venturia nashicola TaxID=86259 RepID=A0A4Z1PJ40_9PEZI|nr:allantoinase precursor [Venturia nashicola]TLD35170.1 allantoinase precursor [Venturia nashicola]
MAPHATGTDSPPLQWTLPDGSQPAPITVLASSRAVVSGRLTEATIIISTITGKVISIFHSVLPPSDFPIGTPYVDHSPHILMPGLVDAHVHLNEPGRTEWEGFWTGTRAAAFGGVTTVVDMPLNAIPPTTTVGGFEEKIAAAQGKCWVDVGFYGGIVPGNEKELKPLVKMGVRGFKGFLIDSGVDEFPAVSSEDIRKVFTELANEPTTVMFHAEMVPPITASVGDAVQHSSQPPFVPTGPLDHYQTFLDSRPPAFETYAVDEILSLAHLAPKLPLHIVHLSALEAIPLLREARTAGINITAETCFHYLSLAAEEVKRGDTRHKCCPPIRSQSNQDALWEELLCEETDGVIKTVVSDHSPCTPNLKLLPTQFGGKVEGEAGSGDFFQAWGGIGSVGLGLPILWTEGEKKDITIEDIVRWCCKNTAKQVGLEKTKGDIGVGMDGDIAVFDDEATFLVEPSTMLFRNKCSPYEGRILKGVVKETWVRGQKVYTRQAGFDEKMGPSGSLLLEPRTTKTTMKA